MAHQYLEENLAALRKKDSILADRVCNLILDSNWEIYHAVDGLKTIKKVLGDHLFRFIHSSVSPKKEAERWAALVQDESETSIILGFGLGYHLLALQKSNPANELVIIEADIELFYLAIKLINLNSIIQNSKVHFLIGERMSSIKEFFYSLSPNSLSYKAHLPSTGLHSEYYQSIKEILEEYIFKNRLMKNQVLSQGIMRLLEETKK